MDTVEDTANKQHTGTTKNRSIIKMKELEQLPAQLLISLVVHNQQIHAPTFGLDVPQYAQDKNANHFILWLHSKAHNQLQAFTALSNYFQAHDQSNQYSKQFMNYMYHHCTNQYPVNNYFNLHLYMRNLPHTVWYSFFEYLLIEQCKLNRQQNLHSILSQFAAHIQKQSIIQYLKQPNQKLFNIFKKILQIAASLNKDYISKFRAHFVDEYLAKLSNTPNQKVEKQSDKQSVFQILKMIELLHLVDPSFVVSEMAKNETFMTGDLYACMCDFERKGANALAINIYGAICKDLDVFNEELQIFIDVYLTLDCYGMHLIKDIWDRFTILCRKSSTPSPLKLQGTCYSIYPVSTLLHIILSKVEQHPNSNVPKYCVQSLLAASPDESTPLFQHLQDTVYGSLVQILNTGTHYNDITHFHKDSKIYGLTRSFYLGYYNVIAQQQDGKQKLKYHLKKLMRAMSKYITFEHCIMGYMSILANIPPLMQDGAGVRLLGKEQADILVELVDRFLIRLTFRKRHKLLQCALACMRDSIDVKQMGLQYSMRNIVMRLPIQLTHIRYGEDRQGIPQIYDIMLINFKWQLNERIGVVKQQVQSLQNKLLARKDIYEEQHQPEVRTLLSRYQQLVIYWVIMGWHDQQNSNQLICSQLQQIRQLANSSYAHPLRHAMAVYTISATIAYSDMSTVMQLIRRTPKSGEHLLAMLSANQHNTLINHSDMLVCLQAVAMSVPQSNSEDACRAYAKFVEYCIAQLAQPTDGDCAYFLRLLLNAIKYKLDHTISYKAIEDSLYKLYENHNTLLPSISSKHRLRLQLLLFCIISHDFQYAWNALSGPTRSKDYIGDLRQYGNIYDYDHYEELFTYYVAVSSTLGKAHRKGLAGMDNWNQYKQGICGVVEESIKAMLHNLDYGIQKKEVISATHCVVQIAMMLGMSEPAAKMIRYVLQVGQKYWGFQRQLVFSLVKQLIHVKSFRSMANGLKMLIPQLVCIQEYRGQDSAIILPEHRQLKVYQDKLLHKQCDYDGTAIRLMVIEWAHTQLHNTCNKTHSIDKVSAEQDARFWLSVFDECMKTCETQFSRQKMFLTGTHRTKIKLWQFLMIYPELLLAVCSTQQYKQIILNCLQVMNQNNLAEVKHYIEVFMLKLIYSKPQPSILAEVSEKIMQQLLAIEGQNGLFKNVSYMVMAGLILELYYHEGLYTVVFSSVCSHVAYYRGLSQYFCYQQIQKAKQSHLQDIKYVLILHKEYLKDMDAIRLTQKLQKIIQGYKITVKTWNIYDNLLKLQPTINGQIVSDDHYLDKLKCQGQQLIKDQKHEDGFMSYKEAWKKIMKQTNYIEPELKQQEVQNASSFQRKIDPSLDDIYSFEPIHNKKKTNNNLIILVVSAEQVAFYGHMARVGEILGIQQLCIPNKKIIDLEDFYNVSVTAEKWLPITEHGFEKIRKQKQLKKVKVNDRKQNRNMKNSARPEKKIKKIQKEDEHEYQFVGKESLQKIIKRRAIQGYKLYLVHKSHKSLISNPTDLHLNKKSLLIIDQLGLMGEQLGQIVDQMVSFNSFFSYHVQATIFIWEYFKLFSLG